VGLAVSGGPDSVALMVLAHAVLGADRFAVATVDHGLRAQSAAEAAHVAQLCAARGIAHTILTLAMVPGPAVQERARDERYRALAAWCAERGLAALVTAHHADDQAETMVMRMNRGAGLRGLAGIRAHGLVPGSTLPLLRPLLAWRHATLVALVDANGIVPVDDPSNRDSRFERVRVRDGLAGAAWLDPAGLAASAGHLAEADAALDWSADRLCADVAGPDIALACDVPRALALRVLERVIARLGGSTPRGRDLARWYDRLAAGQVATLAGVRGDGRARPWRFTVASPHSTR
jgi:tRNA(Ile)-lysidine synthase